MGSGDVWPLIYLRYHYIIGGVEPSHWDQLKKSGSSWDLNPGPSGYRPGTLTTELLDLCGRGVLPPSEESSHCCDENSALRIYNINCCAIYLDHYL